MVLNGVKVTVEQRLLPPFTTQQHVVLLLSRSKVADHYEITEGPFGAFSVDQEDRVRPVLREPGIYDREAIPRPRRTSAATVLDLSHRSIENYGERSVSADGGFLRRALKTRDFLGAGARSWLVGSSFSVRPSSTSGMERNGR
jgi:hypothetical protein